MLKLLFCKPKGLPARRAIRSFNALKKIKITVPTLPFYFFNMPFFLIDPELIYNTIKAQPEQKKQCI